MSTKVAADKARKKRKMRKSADHSVCQKKKKYGERVRERKKERQADRVRLRGKEREMGREETQKHSHTQSQIALQQLFSHVVFLNTL